MKRLIFLLPLLALLFMTDSLYAAKPSKGVIEFVPTVVDSGESFLVIGSEFNDSIIPGEPFDPVHINAATPGCCLAFNVIADDNGEWVFRWDTGPPGTYQFTAFQSPRNKNHKSWKKFVQASIEVRSVEP